MNKIYQKNISDRKDRIKRQIGGFTLIELLVVVLIIGILAAIALPKYQKAVDRSRWTPMLQMERTISRAQEIYYMANGKYASNFEELGLDYPLENEKTFSQGQMRAVFYTEGGTPYVQLYRRKDNTSYENIFLLTFYYASPKRVLRQCRPAYGVSGEDWKSLCLFLMGEGASVQSNGWVVIEE